MNSLTITYQPRDQNSKRLSSLVSIKLIKIASSRYLFKNFIGINDNQINMLKTIKALRILNEDLDRSKAKSVKLFDSHKIQMQDKICISSQVANEVVQFLNRHNQNKIERNEILNGKLSCFNKFIDNFDIIKRLYEEENKSWEFISRWLRISTANLQLWINKYFKQQAKQIDKDSRKEL